MQVNLGTTTKANLARAALAYVQRFGWYVFPIRPKSKKPPLIKEWEKNASNNPNKVYGWWQKWPDANIGIACGLSNLIVIDVDVKNGHQGTETWRDLVLEHDIPDETIIQLTPSGGQHLVYLADGWSIPNSAGKLGPGVDVRGDGGYIVAAPSTLDVGQYMWDVGAHPGDTPALKMPKILASILLDIDKVEHTPAPPIDRSIFIGQRNATLASLAGTMRRRGMSEDAIFAALQQENLTKCAPPLSEEEVSRIAASVSRYEPATVGLERVYPLTDMGNAERMAAQHGQTLRFCHTWNKWLTWDSKRWVIDDTAEVTRRAKETVRNLDQEARLTQDVEIQEAIKKWAKRSESRAKINAMIDLASAEYAIPVRPEHLDVDRYLLNVTNGIVDLKSGELMEHDPAHLMTKLVPYPYHADSQCPRWQEFLNRIMRGNQELIGFLQRAIGYALTGDTREQVVFILYGTGANGKSTLLEVLSTILDDYAMRTPTETLLLKRGGTVSNDVARLKGARFVTAVEAEQGHRLAESMVKQMTGGERLVARFLHAEFFEFVPEFKIFLATNHKPEIIGTDYAIWRRIRLIPFEVTIPDVEQDKDLAKKLLEEASGILRWAVEGCLEWQKQGLGTPREVVRATDGYRAEMDILAGFIDDCCIEELNVTVPLADLYKAYDNWCDESGEKALTKREFGMRMRERGFTQRRGTAGERQWEGVGLRAKPNQIVMGLE